MKKMKEMRKTALVLSTIILGVGIVFSGCQKGQAGGSQSAAQTTLNLWHIYNDQGRGVPIEKSARRFEAANPGVKVVISTYANDPYKTKLKTVSGSDFPDVFHSWGGGWLKSFVDAGLVADISADADAVSSQLNPTMVNLSRFDGKVYGVPYTGGGTILFYNKDIFARFNLQPPQTFADLEAICQTLLANNITPFALANKTKWPGAQHFVLVAMRLGGPDVFQQANDTVIPFTDPVFIEAGQRVIDMVDKGWFPAGTNGLDWDTGQSRMLMYQEKCAMIVQTTGFLGTCRTENPDFYAAKVGVALYPAIAGGKGKATDILGGANSFSVSANTKYRDLAGKLAIWLATDTELHQEFLNNGVVAAKPGIQTDDVLVQEALKQLAEASFLQNYIDQTLSPELAEVHKDTTQGLYGKTLTPQQAADTMQAAFTAQ